MIHDDCSGLENDLAPMLKQIVAGLEQNRAAYEAALAKRRAKRSVLPLPDPEAWRAELDRLLEDGNEDIHIGYWRVSSEEQQEGDGPEVQRQYISSWLLAHKGIPEPHMWVWDTETGTTGDRIGYQFMESAAAHWQVTKIICYSLDRFSREGGQGDVDIKTLRRLGTQVVPATQRIGDGPMGDLVQLLFLGIAAYEAAIIRERTGRGRDLKIKRDGTWNGGTTPYGYSTIGKGQLVVNEAEAKLVLLIFELWKLGYRARAIAESLNRWGVKPKRGAKWYAGTIVKILTSEPQYRAEARWNLTAACETTPIAQPAIMEHRPDPADRDWVYKNPAYPRLRRSVVVPDDLYGDPVVLRAPIWERRFTKGQADAIRTAYHLYDGGTRIRHVATALQALGLKSIRGMEITETTVWFWIRDRHIVEPRVAAADGAVVTEPLEKALGPLELLAIARGRALELRQMIVRKTKAGKDVIMGFPQIARTLNEEGHRTIRGALWTFERVEDLIKGQGMFARIVGMQPQDLSAA